MEVWAWDEETDDMTTFFFPPESVAGEQQLWCTAKSGCNWNGGWGNPIGSESECTDKAGVAVEDGQNMICAECLNGNSDCWELSKAGVCKYNTWDQGFSWSDCGEAGSVLGANSGEVYQDWQTMCVKTDANDLDSCLPQAVRGEVEVWTYSWDGFT